MFAAIQMLAGSALCFFGMPLCGSLCILVATIASVTDLFADDDE